MTYPAGCPQHGRALRRQQVDRDRRQSYDRLAQAFNEEHQELALTRLEAQNRPADTRDAVKSVIEGGQVLESPRLERSTADLRELNRSWLEQQQRKAWPEMFKTVITKYAREIYL
jgi:hypothetical protein